VLFLGWVLLTDSWRHVRTEAVHALARHNTEHAQAFIALALADRSQLVVRAAQAALKKQGGLTAFLVLVALWEDQTRALVFLREAVALAKRNPQSAMRQVLPLLER
jgi:HEAT repeat protein